MVIGVAFEVRIVLSVAVFEEGVELGNRFRGEEGFDPVFLLLTLLTEGVGYLTWVVIKWAGWLCQVYGWGVLCFMSGLSK